VDIEKTSAEFFVVRWASQSCEPFEAQGFLIFFHRWSTANHQSCAYKKGCAWSL